METRPVFHVIARPSGGPGVLYTLCINKHDLVIFNINMRLLFYITTHLNVNKSIKMQH